MQLSIRHTTRYRFGQPASHGLQRLRLRPKSTHGQQVIAWAMQLEGARLEAEYEDQHGNHTALVSLEAGRRGSHGGLQRPGADQRCCRHCRPACGLHAAVAASAARPPLTAPGPRMNALARRFDPAARAPLDMLHDLSRRVHDAVAYETGQTDAETTAEAAMGLGRGVCQDHAHIFIGIARALGVAGTLCQRLPDDE